MKKLFIVCIVMLFALAFKPGNAFSSSGNCNMEGFLCESGTRWHEVCGETEEEKDDNRLLLLYALCMDDYLESEEPIEP